LGRLHQEQELRPDHHVPGQQRREQQHQGLLRLRQERALRHDLQRGHRRQLRHELRRQRRRRLS
jgi:hypothetical protein